MTIYHFHLENWESVGVSLGKQALVFVVSGHINWHFRRAISWRPSELNRIVYILPSNFIFWNLSSKNDQVGEAGCKECNHCIAHKRKKSQRGTVPYPKQTWPAMVDPRLWNTKGPLETMMQIYISIFFNSWNIIKWKRKKCE